MATAKKDATVAAKKDATPDLVQEHLDAAEAKAVGLSGYSLVLHKLDVAFIHALAGAKADAEKALEAADAEIAKYKPSFMHLECDILILKAKVLAALAHK